MQSPSSPPLNLSILEYQSLPPNTHIYTHRPTKEIHKIKQNYTFTPNVQTNRTQNALMNIEHINFDIRYRGLTWKVCKITNPKSL